MLSFRNETLIQELFGGSLEEAVGTDNDNFEVDFDVNIQDVFGTIIQEISKVK